MVAGAKAPLRGNEIGYLVQPVNATVGSDALIPGMITESTHTREGDTTRTQTRSGNVVAPGAKEESMEITFLMEPGDEGYEALEEAYDNDQMIKVWRYEKRLNADGEHPARFAYAYVENLESDEGDEFVEYSTTLPVFQSSKKGTLPELPDSILNPNQYEFEEPGDTGAEDTSGTT